MKMWSGRFRQPLDPEFERWQRSFDFDRRLLRYELEALCLERDVAHFKQEIGLKYAELVYFGLWFTPLREALDAFVEKTQAHMTGKVTLSLYKGNVSVASRESEHSLYRTDLSSFTMGDSYDQKDAEGFIRILGLPSRSYAQVHAEKVKEALK